MGNDLVSWRAAIGVHHGRGYCCGRAVHFTNFVFSFIFSFAVQLVIYVWSYAKFGFYMSCVQDRAMSLQFSLILLLLLLKAGDVETNPGPDTTDVLSILHCNIRSIRNKLDYIRDNTLDFDILCFTETHLDQAVRTDDILLSSKFGTPYRKDRSNHGGGILIYINNNLLHSRIYELELFCAESIWVQIKTKLDSYLLGVFYSPRTADSVFFENLNRNLEKAFEISKNIIVLGDLNEDLLNPAFHNLHNLLLINSMHNVIHEPTRQRAILDPVILPLDMQFSDAGVLHIPPEISDHHATYIHIPFPYELHSSYERTVWNYKRANFELLNDKINSTDWSVLLEGSVNDACTTFTNKLMEFLKICIPSKIVRIRPDDKPWYDSEIRKYSRKRDRMRAIAKTSGKPQDWSKFKNLRNKVNNLKKHAKEHFYSTLEINLTNLEVNDKKGFWKLIRHFVKNSDSTNIPPLCSLNNDNQIQVFTTDVEKANCLNNYFVSISSIDETNAQLPVASFRTQNKLREITVGKKEIEELIKVLNVNKACGPDLITHKMLKGCLSSVSTPLLILFNRSLSECIFPDSWKIAHVTPIFKKGDRTLASNYRPVSLLSCVGKLFERLVFKNVYNFLLQNNVLYKYQSGFLPNHSTVYQLVDIYHHICQGFENNQMSCMVFCDISKAFDRVWHKGLIFKLRENGIDDKLLGWISNYLNNRKQKVVLQTGTSSLQNISAGVPQGSVLGPLFFLIYVNDITDSLLSLTRLYADDSSLFCSTSNIQDIEGMLNHDLHQISLWAKRWLVNFNPNKTEAVLFSLKANSPTPSLLFDNVNINFVDNHKHLGLTLKSNGQWSTHIANILQSASKTLNIMRKLKFTLSRAALNQIFLSYIRPILEYASIVWDGCNQTDADSLDKMQNEAARIVTGLTRSVSLNNLYRECGWDSLRVRRERQKCCFMYKFANESLPSYITDLIPPTVGNISHYELRNRDHIETFQTRTSIFKKSCIPSSIRLWNNLDPSIRQSSSINSFKNSLIADTAGLMVPKHYYFSLNRFVSVMHARIRNNCSDLNEDLFNNHIRLDTTCTCQAISESASHYFFECRLYNAARIQLFHETRAFHPLNIELLLFGDSALSYEQNCILFEAVQFYILRTKRFKR